MNSTYTNLKRSYSISDSDGCSEEEINSCAVTSGSQSYRSPNRKRRRGAIEKRRRDRINCSLDELKKLVPQALEKSGSAKLEKAEILQMTVDHLKLFHTNKVYDMNGAAKPGSLDTHKIAADYHSLGFRECASEVARYLISVEGLDDIRIRLMSHLQMFMSQQEFSNRALQHGYNGQANQISVSQFTPPSHAWSAYPGYNSEMSQPKPATDPYSSMGPDMQTYFSPIAPLLAPVSTASVSKSSTTSVSSAPQAHPSLTTLASPADNWIMNNQFHNGLHFSAFNSASHSQNLNGYGKPYRPWGAPEMASC